MEYNKTGDIAAKNGDLYLIMNNDKLEYSTDAMEWAAEYGHLEILKYLHEKNKEDSVRYPGCTKRAIDYASIHGQLEIVKWLHENRTEGCTRFAMDAAAYNGHLNMLKWLYERNKEERNPENFSGLVRYPCCTKNAMYWAEKNGHNEVIEYLKSIESVQN